MLNYVEIDFGLIYNYLGCLGTAKAKIATALPSHTLTGLGPLLNNQPSHNITEKYSTASK